MNRTACRSPYRLTHRVPRIAHRSGARSPVRLSPGVSSAARYWSRPPNPAIELCKLLKELLKTPRPGPPGPGSDSCNTRKSKNRSGNGRFWTDFRPATERESKNWSGNGRFWTDFDPVHQEPTAHKRQSALLLSLVHYEQLLHSVAIATEQVRKYPRRLTLTQIVRILNFASALGRRAVDLPLDNAPNKFKRPQPAPGYLSVEEALKKIYGSDDEVTFSQSSALQPADGPSFALTAQPNPSL